jgi:protein disulfide-isomerase
MRTLLFCLGLAAGFCRNSFGGVDWCIDLPTALLHAKGEKKPVLLCFTGSDWSEPSKALKSKVFDQPEFAVYAQRNLIMMEVDFPHHSPQSPELRSANKKLAALYGVHAYPTFIILNSSGDRIGFFGYMGGGAKEIIDFLERTPALAQQRPPEISHAPVVYEPTPAAPPMKYGDLALKSISGPKNRRIALINDQSLMTGETGKVKVRDVLVEVTMKEIHDDSVTVMIAGKPVELKFPVR